MTIIALCLYFIGMLLVLSVFEVAEDAKPTGMIILCLFWPFVTLRMVAEDMFLGGADED